MGIVIDCVLVDFRMFPVEFVLFTGIVDLCFGF